MKKYKQPTWIRLGRGKTQAQLADAVGVSIPTVQNALHGLTDTPLAREIRAKALAEFGGQEYVFRPA